jgi:poly(A) polymerase
MITDSAVKKIFTIFQNADHEILIAGGAVRDHLMGIEPKDIDFATSARPHEAMALLTAEGFMPMPLGIEHGTIVVQIENKWFEITTFRKDIETDGRHAVVEYTKDPYEDAFRRDLTINAMFMDSDGVVVDYVDVGGQNDMRHKVIRMVGRPEDRIQEDYLRILRVFRFLSRFEGWTVDPATLMACAKHAEGLKQISGERIRAELLKILAGPNAKTAVEWMYNLRIDTRLGIEMHPDCLNKFVDDADPICKLAGFVAIDREWYKDRVKMSNKELRMIDCVERLIVLLNPGIIHIMDLIQARGFTPAEVKTALHALGFIFPHEKIDWIAEQKMPVNGKDLIDSGMKPGPSVGHALTMMRNMWICSEMKPTKEDLFERYETFRKAVKNMKQST